METTLTEKYSGIEIAQDIAEFYGTGLHQDRLKAQLAALHCSDTDRSLDDLQSIVSYLKGLNEVENKYYSKAIKVAKLILVIPATNALSERSFSALCRFRTDSILLLRIGNEFIQRNSSRIHIL